MKQTHSPGILFANHQELTVFHILGDVLVHLAIEDKLTEQKGKMVECVCLCLCVCGVGASWKTLHL